MIQAKTIDGHEARVYATDGEPPYIYHGAIKTQFGWEVCSWKENGTYGVNSCSFDLDLKSIEEQNQIVSEQDLLDLGFKLTKHYNHDEYNTKRYELDHVHIEFTFIGSKLETVDLTLEEVNCIDNPTLPLIKTLLTELT